MSAKFATIIVFSISLTGANLAYADSGHDETKETGSSMHQMAAGDGQLPPEGKSTMMGEMTGHDHQEMMKMMMGMMKMHGSMMDGHGKMGRMGMMDRDVLDLMHKNMGGKIKAVADGSGSITQAEIMDHMSSVFIIADEDGDGALTLEEFESLHNMMTRNNMVDRFQHLDENGDGKVTSEEMVAPTHRMRMRSQSGNMTDKQ